MLSFSWSEILWISRRFYVYLFNYHVEFLKNDDSSCIHSRIANEADHKSWNQAIIRFIYELQSKVGLLNVTALSNAKTSANWHNVGFVWCAFGSPLAQSLSNYYCTSHFFLENHSYSIFEQLVLYESFFFGKSRPSLMVKWFESVVASTPAANR